MTTEERYTLAEARALLAQRECVSDGHDLDQVRTADGNTLWVYCTRCPARFLPADGPRPDPGQTVIVYDGIAYPAPPTVGAARLPGYGGEGPDVLV